MPFRGPLLALAIAAACSSQALPAPADLAAIRMYEPIDCLALLSWGAVPGATGYRVSGTSAGSTQTFDVGPAQAIIRWSRGGDVAVTVRALGPDGPGDPTLVLHVPEAMPDFQILISGTAAHLSWPAGASPALVARGPNRETMALLATVDGSGYDDQGLTPGATYFWAVVFGVPPLSFVPAVQSRTVPAAAGAAPAQG
jgi:hypothetical protein